MTIADVISTAPGGKAQLRVPGYPVTFLLACHPRDFHPMDRLQQWLAGALTPGMTLRNGMAISETLMAIMTVPKIVDLFLHEHAHWWQFWRRMGPEDAPATYLWQIIVKFCTGRTSTIHDRINMEREAEDISARIMAIVEDMLRTQQPVTFDVETWFRAEYPALRQSP